MSLSIRATCVPRTLRVSSAVVAQSLRSIDVEASAATRRVGVDHNEAICISEGSVLRAAEISLSRAGAVVDSDNERRRAGEFRRLVDIHAHIVGVGADVGCHLNQLVLGSLDAGGHDESSDEGFAE